MTDRTEPVSLVVFGDDWGRHPSSSQHLVKRLLPRYPVLWVNTIGMRRPALNRVTLTRGMEKLGQWFLPARGINGANDEQESNVERLRDENPRVLSPRMWPWFSHPHDRWLNRRLLVKQLAPLIEQAPGEKIAITTVPIVADLIGALPVDRWVYYCVDDFSKWPAMDQRVVNVMEEKLVREADTIIAVSEKLQERMAGWDRDSLLLSHGVDLDLWRNATPAGESSPLSGLERPIVLFWGSIDWQMDLEFLRRLSSDMDRGTIALLGPVTDPHPDLFSIARVVHVPKVPYEKLPPIAADADVLMMPYIDAPGLRESQPLKLKEYLASGKPAVVRDLPANRFWSDALDLADTPERFATLVLKRLAGGLPDDQATARGRLTGETWDEKAAVFEQAVRGESVACPVGEGTIDDR